MRRLRKALRRVHRRNGQAMVEYSLISSLLFFVFAPVALLGIWPTFLNAFNIYIHSFYWLLNFPFP